MKFIFILLIAITQNANARTSLLSAADISSNTLQADKSNLTPDSKDQIPGPSEELTRDSLNKQDNGSKPKLTGSSPSSSAKEKATQAKQNYQQSIREDNPQNSNLPYYYLSKSIPQEEPDLIVLLPEKTPGIFLDKFKPGDLISASLKEGVLAISGDKVTVRAEVKSGELKGSILLGEANLESNSKRTLIEFKKLQIKPSGKVYQLKAEAMDQDGLIGIEGRLFSNEDKYFAAELLSAAASGYTDATIHRTINQNGNYQIEPSTDTFAKKALVSALGVSANRFSEKLKSAPEYSVIQGQTQIKVLITEQPKLIE